MKRTPDGRATSPGTAGPSPGGSVALRESEERFHALIEAAPIAVVIVDEGGRIALLNARAEAVFGYPRRELLGQAVELLIPPAARRAHVAHRAAFQAAPRARPMGLGLDLAGRRRDGSTFPVEVGLGSVELDGRRQTVAFITDITERKRAEDAVQDERSRLARDLHDAVTQSLFSASLIAEVLPTLWARNPAEGERRLAELRQLTRGALAEMRLLLLELRPGALADAPLPELLRQLADTVVNRAGLPIEVTVEGRGTLPAEVQEVVYRAAQEALNNVARHAGASRARLTLAYRPDGVALAVADDGVGFVPGTADASHLGLRIMRERADAVVAALTIDSAPGQGTCVTLVWPAPGAG